MDLNSKKDMDKMSYRIYKNIKINPNDSMKDIKRKVVNYLSKDSRGKTLLNVNNTTGGRFFKNILSRIQHISKFKSLAGYNQTKYENKMLKDYGFWD